MIDEQELRKNIDNKTDYQTASDIPTGRFVKSYRLKNYKALIGFNIFMIIGIVALTGLWYIFIALAVIFDLLFFKLADAKVLDTYEDFIVIYPDHGDESKLIVVFDETVTAFEILNDELPKAVIYYEKAGKPEQIAFEIMDTTGIDRVLNKRYPEKRKNAIELKARNEAIEKEYGKSSLNGIFVKLKGLIRNTK